MQLYSSSFSPYAARCRIVIFHKQLPVEIVPPPGGMGSAELKAKNPIGKIPVLDLGEDTLAESGAILDYLDARFPSPAMRPADALANARQTEIIRFCDLHIAPAMFPLFLALRTPPAPEAVAGMVAALEKQQQTLEALLPRKQSGNDLPLDLADAALLPVLWYSQILIRHFAQREVFATMPVCAAWWQRASAAPAAARVLAEMEAGLKAAMPKLFP